MTQNQTMNTSGSGSIAGEGISSNLLNQQLDEVRVDKNILMERLNIAETARFELRKGRGLIFVPIIKITLMYKVCTSCELLILM